MSPWASVGNKQMIAIGFGCKLGAFLYNMHTLKVRFGLRCAIENFLIVITVHTIPRLIQLRQAESVRLNSPVLVVSSNESRALVGTPGCEDVLGCIFLRFDYMVGYIYPSNNFMIHSRLEVRRYF
jgi:hypothetical protein